MLIPNVELINGIWRGKIQLDSWSNFFKDVKYIDLNIGGDSKVEKLEESHKLAYEYIVSNQENLLNLILNELMGKYSDMQEEYGYDEDKLEEFMPSVSDIDGFKNILNPKRIYILNVENEGISYVGFHFMCSWDEEHDFGVMMHKARIVKMGSSDSAFLSWIAEEDKSNC
ncbi:hypothetical protein [Clostridium sp. HBUAS56017]|uniref:DUF6985 domain-containing protein n=1 Tax=Clostridium sp. HBUAS56017 TaxID=2571128 RepID=UPI001A9C1AFC|nr:hypothetical protein [Clostridium sp. HBUAS56017]